MPSMQSNAHFAKTLVERFHLVLDCAGGLSQAVIHAKYKPPARVFYVTIHAGRRYGLLYGPLPTRSAATRAKGEVENVALDVAARQVKFAKFSTRSLPRDRAVAGKLNDLLPPIANLDVLLHAAP